MKARFVLAASTIAAVLTTTITIDARADKRQCARTSEAGQRDRAEGRLRSARDKFRMCAQEDCPDVVRRDCLEWTQQVEAALPTVVFILTDANGDDVRAARLLVDGEAIAIDGKAVPLDPGPHVVHAELPGGRMIDKEIQVAEGAKLRQVRLVMPGPAPSTSTSTSTSGKGESKTLGWVLGGTGVAVLGLTAYLGLSGLSRASDLEGSCKPSCDPDDVDAIRTRFRISYVTGAIGGALVAVGLYLVVFPLGTTGTTASVSAGPGRADLSIRF